jgi:hypothetical protein
MGAQAVTRTFTDYAEQRNHALLLPFAAEWIVMLDADERMTPELALEIEQTVASVDSAVAMFLVRRKDIFMGRWLRRSSGYPTWFPRLLRRGTVRVTRAVNEAYVAQGEARKLSHHIEHYPFAKGITWWFERHNRYSTLEARLLVAGHRQFAAPLKHLFSPDPQSRRSALKGLAYALPGRPFLIFFYLYVVRLGLLDGVPGFQFACMRLAYEIMIDAKALDLRRRARIPGTADATEVDEERRP